MAHKGERIVVPKFKTEAEEARWWYDNRDKVEDALINAMDNGTIRRGAAQRLTNEARASRNVTIRMAEADAVALAKYLMEHAGAHHDDAWYTNVQNSSKSTDVRLPRGIPMVIGR